jgi:hypothetical protein
MYVDFPHPEGPIRAVIFFSGISRFIFLRACLAPYQRLRFLETILELNRHPL